MVSSSLSYKRAVALMTFTAFLVPLTGLLTAPILARELSPFGRGELAAAMAPAAVMLTFATLGLPEALTYFLAKSPESRRRLLLICSGITLVLAVVFIAIIIIASGPLAGGRIPLARLMVLSALITVPQLIWNVFRGAATGLQVWWPIVTERVVNAILRVVLIFGFAVTGRLTVFTALLMSILLPAASGFIYLVLARRSTPVVLGNDSAAPMLSTIPAGAVVKFGLQIWLGSVVGMLLSRTSQLLLTPLAGETELGIFSVAVTVSDIVLIIVSAVQSTLYGVTSRHFDLSRAQATARATLFLASVFSLVYGLTLPILIPLLFGRDYASAVLPSWIMVLSALVGIPGLIAGVTLNASGRPIFRSIAYATALVLNVGMLLLLAPALGAVGAALSALVASGTTSVVLVILASRFAHGRSIDFVWVRRSDATSAIDLVRRLMGNAWSKVRRSA